MYYCGILSMYCSYYGRVETMSHLQQLRAPKLYTSQAIKRIHQYEYPKEDLRDFFDSFSLPVIASIRYIMDYLGLKPSYR